MRESLTKREVIFPLIKKARHLHTGWRLCGEPRNALLHVSDTLLSYLLSLLRNEPPFLPEVLLNEWSKLITFLNSHWILPMLYWKIAHLPQELHPPGQIISQLRKAFMISRVHCLQMERQLLELVNAFNRKGVCVLVLKGPALARFLYPDPATRPSSDIDLLVRPEQFIKAREILKDIGYHNEAKLFEVFKDFYCEENFIPQMNSKDKFTVGLHWSQHIFLGNEPGSKVDELFFRAIKVETGILTFETLHPVDALIHAALHLIMTHNQDMRLIWIYDLALLAQKLLVPNDWEVLQKRSSAWGARLPVENSLKIAEIWTGFQIPKNFNDFSTWPEPADIEVVAMANAIQRHDRPDILLKLCLSNSSTIAKKFHILFKLFFPNPRCVRRNHPPSREMLLPLCYLRRWWKYFKREIRYLMSTL